MIIIQGTHTLQATREELWPHLFDPGSLLEMIPGCYQLTKVNDHEYKGELRIGLAGVSGNYSTTVRLMDVKPPEYCAFDGEISGSSGEIKGEASFYLVQTDEGTRIDYLARGIISGALGKLAPRFIEGVVKTLINLGLERLDRRIRSCSPIVFTNQ